MRIILALALLASICGCQQIGKAVQSIATGQYQPVTVVSCSGLGNEPIGLRRLEQRIDDECPTATIIKTHWTHNVEDELKAWDGRQPLIIIGHSFGGGRVVYLCQRSGKPVTALFLLDPVSPPVSKPDESEDFTLPPNVKSSRCYLRPGFQLFVAASHPIQNPKPEWANIPTALSHNAIPADEAIQGEIVASIQKQAKPEIPILSPIGRGLEAVGKIARGVFCWTRQTPPVRPHTPSRLPSRGDTIRP